VPFTLAPAVAVTNCPKINVTENGPILWSLTLTGSEVLDQDSRDAVFYQLALRYNWLETKKEKMELLIEIESIILPKLGFTKMHRKSLIRRLRRAMITSEIKRTRGPRSKYTDFDKYHLVQL
jgi:hypothetical protein